MSAPSRVAGRTRPLRLALALLASLVAAAVAIWVAIWAVAFGPACLEQRAGHKSDFDNCGVILAPLGFFRQ